MPCRIATRQQLQGGSQPCVHAGQCAPIGLVDSVRVGVGRALGQSLHGRRKVHQHGRQRQFTAQIMNLGEVMPERDLRLALQGMAQGLRVDIGVAIPIAAYPLTHAKKGCNRMAAQRLF